MGRRGIILVGVVLAAMVALSMVALSYASPYWTLRQLKVAAQETNAAELNKHIDYPALRDSVKSQIRAVMGKEAGTAPAVGDFTGGAAAGTPGASMSAVFAGAMLDQFVDALVTPEAIAEMMGNVDGQGDGKRKAEAEADRKDVARGEDASDMTVAVAYEGWHKVVATVSHRASGRGPVDLYLQRTGLFSWKLAGVSLPR